MKTERNEMCTCGSGMKSKNCHGDTALQTYASRIASGLLNLYCLQRAHEKDLLDGATVIQAIDELVANINKSMPASAKVVTTYQVEQPEEPEEIVEPEPINIDELQQNTELCKSCGRRLPAGMECMKCKKGTE